MATSGTGDFGEIDVAQATAGVLQDRPIVAYALIFGSRARHSQRPGSDLDVALGLRAGATLEAAALGSLIADLEAATGLTVDITVLDEAPPALAFRVFRDGQPVLVRDRARMAERRARAILDYLDFRPCEELCADGVLRAAARG